jgi:DNA adenine methylase
MDKNIQSVYRTPNGYCYKVLFNQRKTRIGKEEFQFLEKKLVSTHDEALQPKKLKPLFKWSGGKLKEIPKFANYFPKSFDRFVEPFVGGASVLFHLQNKKNAISDTHYEVFCFYSAIKNGKSSEIYDFMLNQPNDEKTYYWVRNSMSIESPLDVAKRFFYLRKTCYRGMLRYNKSGHFNIPFGRYKKINFSDLLDGRYEKLLRNTTIHNTSFEPMFTKYNDENNFFFLDPPYDCVFNNYNSNAFDKENHQLLFDKFSKTKNKCLLILNKTDFLVNLYKNYIFDEYEQQYSFKLHSGRVKSVVPNKHLIICNYSSL